MPRKHNNVTGVTDAHSYKENKKETLPRASLGGRTIPISDD